MLTFQVNDMTCGHCVSTITKAIQATDKDAKVTIELAQHLVVVEPAASDARELSDAIAEAGYTPIEVQSPDADPKPARNSSCCGGCG